jgi:hypothetical protein
MASEQPPPVQEDTMLYLTQESVRAEAEYRRERIARDFRAASRWPSWSLRRNRRDEPNQIDRNDWRLAA